MKVYRTDSRQPFKKSRGHGKLTEDDVNEAMREVRMALLEADVNFKVVKQFIKTVKERAIGQDILETLTPAQVVIKIVDEEPRSSWAEMRRAVSTSARSRRRSS